jgi:hypothetical protein
MPAYGWTSLFISIRRGGRANPYQFSGGMERTSSSTCLLTAGYYHRGFARQSPLKLILELEIGVRLRTMYGL